MCEPATPVKNGHFIGATFYCLHAPAHDNFHIQTRKKTLEFSSVVLPTPSPNLHCKQITKNAPTLIAIETVV